ncbi:hypothetical protein D3C86_1820630 [compost metagenome]
MPFPNKLRLIKDLGNASRNLTPSFMVFLRSKKKFCVIVDATPTPATPVEKEE